MHKAIQNFSLALIEAGIINTIHNNTHLGTRCLFFTDKCTSTHTHTHVRVCARKHTCAHTHTHTKWGKGKTDCSVSGEGVTKCSGSGPFGMFCYHVVTKHAKVTRHAGSASIWHILVTKRAEVTKCATITTPHWNLSLTKDYPSPETVSMPCTNDFLTKDYPSPKIVPHWRLSLTKDLLLLVLWSGLPLRA